MTQIKPRQQWLAVYSSIGCQSAPAERAFKVQDWMPHVLGAMSREWMTRQEIKDTGIPSWALQICLPIAEMLHNTVERKGEIGFFRFRLRSDMLPATMGLDWIHDCLLYHGRILLGSRAHWCYDWDELPIDETCVEIELCVCKTL